MLLVRAVARAVGRAADAMVSTPPRAAPLNGRVLVVDDNSVNRKILARQLELAGASTDSAAGGEEALELWRTGRYDLVLADLQMPTMDGFELARRIRASEAAERRPRTPILAVTASTLEDQEAEEPGGRHGRLHHQADRHRAAASHPRCLAEGRRSEREASEPGHTTATSSSSCSATIRGPWPRSSASSWTPPAKLRARSREPTISRRSPAPPIG